MGQRTLAYPQSTPAEGHEQQTGQRVGPEQAMILHAIFRARPAQAGVLALIAATMFASVAIAERDLPVTPATLNDVLATAGPGDVLTLAPGQYPPLALRQGGAMLNPLKMRAADPDNRPVFPELLIVGAQYISLTDLTFDLIPRADTREKSFRIQDARGIILRDLLFDGAERPDAEGIARPWGIGLNITDSIDISLTGSELRGFARGLVAARTEQLSVSDNLIHGMREDGMNFVQVRDVLIEDNEIRDFARAIGSSDHSDMIQFWTRGTKTPSDGIIIRNNLLTSGEGRFTQSIFMRNEEVDSNRAGESMYYRDVVIEGNVIINAQLHGITVGATSGLTINRNTVVRNAVSQGPELNPGRWTPRINIDDRSRDVLVLGNVSHAEPQVGWQPDWVVAGNAVVQDRVPGQSNHYDRVFRSVDPTRPARIEDFAARPDGLLGGRDIGAPRLIALSEMAALPGPDTLRDTTPPTDTLSGIIRLYPDLNVIRADGGRGAPPLEYALGGPAIMVGDTLTPTVLSREMTSALFDASRFTIKMRLKPDGDYRGAGEVLRLHESFRVNVTGRGIVEVEVLTDIGGVARLKSRPTRLYRDGELDLTISYDGPVGSLRIMSGDELIGERPLSGRLRPMQDWGLSFGNPFGKKLSFDGRIEEFEVRTDPPDPSALLDTGYHR